MVVLDIKGENYDTTAGYRAERGQAVYAFSPFDETARSHRWNPLTAVRSSPLHRVGDLLAIGQVFFPNDGSGSSSEAFFSDQARNLFLGLGLLLLESPELPRTVGEMLRQSSGQGRPLKDHLSASIQRRGQGGRPLSDECVDALNRLLSNSENTLSSVVATFNAPLVIFADAVVDAATSADDFRLQDLRRERMSVYVRIPPNRLASARPLLNLFFSQLVALNTQQLPAQDPTLRLQCLLVHDEFTAMGTRRRHHHGRRVPGGLQPASADGHPGDVAARCGLRRQGSSDVCDKPRGLQILFAPREQRDADEYSAMLGQFTERATSRGRSRSYGGQGHSSVSRNDSDQRRALLLPQEFKELGSERLVAIVENCKPILGEKLRYHLDPIFPGTAAATSGGAGHGHAPSRRARAAALACRPRRARRWRVDQPGRAGPRLHPTAQPPRRPTGGRPPKRCWTSSARVGRRTWIWAARSNRPKTPDAALFTTP